MPPFIYNYIFESQIEVQLYWDWDEFMKFSY